MRKVCIFFYRLVLAAVLAVAISYLFFKDVPWTWTIILAVVMLILAYLFEYHRKKDKNLD